MHYFRYPLLLSKRGKYKHFIKPENFFSFHFYIYKHSGRFFIVFWEDVEEE